jgi:nucleotide-binding universal stress UspA family protein
MMPGATAEMLDMEVQEAEEYLLKLRGDLESSGFTVTYEVLRGDPASLIVETARAFQADLIVLGTHARCGMDAFWSGSVAPKICKQCKMPLLFVPLE